MDRIRVNSFQWAAGWFCSFLGALMLVAPHTFAFLNPENYPLYLFVWGLLLLFSGIALFSLPALSLPRWPVVGVHLLSGGLLLFLAGSLAITGAWIAALAFAFLSLGLLASAGLQRSWQHEPVPKSVDLFTALLGLNILLTGIAFLGRFPRPALTPLFEIDGMRLLGFGLAFSAAGLGLVGVQVSAYRRPENRPRWFSAAIWAAHGLAAVSFFAFLVLCIRPQRFWLGAGYYGGFGAALALLPWLERRKRRLDPASLQSRLAFVLGISMALPLILTLAMVGEQEERFARAEALARQENQAQALEQSVTTYIELHRSALQAMATQSHLMEHTPSELSAYLGSFAAAYPDVSVFSLYDKSGLPVASTQPQAMESALAGSENFETPRRSLQPSWEIQPSLLNHHTVLAFSTPILDDTGGFAGVAAFELPTDQVAEFLAHQPSSEMDPGQLERVYLVDDQGRAIVHPDLAHVENLADLSAWPPVSALLQGQVSSGRLAYRLDPRNPETERLSGFARLPDLGWGVVVERPSSTVLADLYAGRNMAFGGMLLFLVAMTSAGALLAGWLTAPLGALTRAVVRLTEGDATVPLPRSSFPEINRLAAAFTQMRQRLAARTAEREQALRQLQQAKEELEQRVAARTAELGASEREFRALFELSAVGQSQVDPETGRYIKVNSKYCEITGYSQEEVLGMTFHQITHPEDRERDAQIYQEVVEGKTQDWMIQKRYVRKDGRIIWVEVVGRAICDEYGKLVRTVAIVQDITERKKAEEMVKTYAARLERSNQDLQDFAFIASHDLQEPLRKVIAFGDRLKSLPDPSHDPRRGDYIDRMQKAAIRMQAMISDLLEYSRITTRGEPFRPVELDQIAREVISDLELRLESSGGRVQLSDLPKLEADPLQMRQLLQNLIGNALKFHRPDISPQVQVYGKIIPSQGDKPDLVQVFVADNGIGFEEKYLERIFQPFQRLHGRSEYEGSGIGLAICRKIVDRHGGSLAARSAPGQGTTFVVTLPKKQA